MKEKEPIKEHKKDKIFSEDEERFIKEELLKCEEESKEKIYNNLIFFFKHHKKIIDKLIAQDMERKIETEEYSTSKKIGNALRDILSWLVALSQLSQNSERFGIADKFSQIYNGIVDYFPSEGNTKSEDIKVDKEIVESKELSSYKSRAEEYLNGVLIKIILDINEIVKKYKDIT